MPTPAVRATASRLASEPPALNTTFAASRTRSRFRTASARGFRVVLSDLTAVNLDPLKSGGTLRMSLEGNIDTLHQCQAMPKNRGRRLTEDYQVVGTSAYAVASA